MCNRKWTVNTSWQIKKENKPTLHPQARNARPNKDNFLETTLLNGSVINICGGWKKSLCL